MKLSPTIEVDTFLTQQETNQLAALVYAQSVAKSDIGDYIDSGKDGKHKGKKIATFQ